jgi:hypothetical protein
MVLEVKESTNMHKKFALLVIAIIFTGCTLTFPGPPPSSGGYVYVEQYDNGCGPEDFEYTYTLFDCPEVYYEVVLCDPDDVYIRAGCYYPFDDIVFDLSTDGACHQYHICEEW